MAGITRFQWPRWRPRIPTPWPDHIKQYDYLDWRTQRELAYARIDKDGFGYWTVFVAGAGFLTDAYDLFAVNTMLPILEIVYWNGSIPAHEEISINLATLVGTVLGQVLVGILADRYGRKKLYGIELIIIMLATVGLALCSKGAMNSVNILAWLISWRLLMGIGIGGDYPLSAVICAEFAPRKHRARMLATVFFMQPVGALMANLVAIITVAAFKSHISENANPSDCMDQCLHATDQIWRWIVGFGAIPPAFAVVLRLYIPESPRYTLDVEKDPYTAGHDIKAYFGNRSRSTSTGQEPMILQPIAQREQLVPGGVENPREVADDNEVIVTETQQPKNDIPREALPEPRPPNGTSERSSTLISSLRFGERQELTPSPLPSTIQPGEVQHMDELDIRRKVSKETWCEYWQGLRKFLFTDGNWTDLAGTSISWLVLDFSFYFLGVNSPKIITRLWNSQLYTEIYPMLMEYGYRALIATSLGAVLGGAIFIWMAKFRWQLQLYGFWILAGLFIAVGVCFITLLGTKYFAAIIALYALCNLFFNLGPNTSTFIIAAEVFPTRYRCTCHGISAASGKLGSIIAQVFLAKAKFGGADVNDPDSKWLGWVLLVFTLFMAFGAGITKFWAPNPCDKHGESRKLEDLGLGKQARKQMEERERQEEEDSDTY